ncbi:MAG TPA: hypothetical protein VKT82_26960 [Ktedonobacterales bacterium]|nr:hypothetical protein [Ktedonobacterales bacterium]
MEWTFQQRYKRLREPLIAAAIPPCRASGLCFAKAFWLAAFLLLLVVFCGNLVVGDYGLMVTLALIVDTSVWFAVSLVLFWRKSTDRAALLFSLQLFCTGGYFFPPLPLALERIGLWWLPVDVAGVLAGATLTFVYTFPDGHFVPRFTRWVAVGMMVVSLLPVPVPGVYPWNWWVSPFYTLVRVVFYISLALALLYRYRHASTPVQRQQIKWVVFAILIIVGDVSVVELLVAILPAFFPALALPLPTHRLIDALAYYFVPVIVPLSIGIALLRYRLWEVDNLINKALVYGLLTGLLGAAYVGLILGLEGLAEIITGSATNQQPVALVVSTLVIAALFQPVRQRLQG